MVYKDKSSGKWRYICEVCLHNGALRYTRVEADIAEGNHLKKKHEGQEAFAPKKPSWPDSLEDLDMYDNEYPPEVAHMLRGIGAF